MSGENPVTLKNIELGKVENVQKTRTDPENTQVSTIETQKSVEYIPLEDPFQYFDNNLLPEERPGRVRHTAIWRTPIDQLHFYFKNEREKEGHHVFQIPFSLKNAAAVVV